MRCAEGRTFRGLTGCVRWSGSNLICSLNGSTAVPGHPGGDQRVDVELLVYRTVPSQYTRLIATRTGWVHTNSPFNRTITNVSKVSGAHITCDFRLLNSVNGSLIETITTPPLYH
ncbi:hypothetical protein P4641_20450 [Halalkalibacterium halodurans]|uniref:hypothetical protein n=1 Tax=Halalkalibacterium halodurans TaxID=86665 RepID=UPI002E21FF00|nr:hypothetical protein [Halalkalibacterium halodurans]